MELTFRVVLDLPDAARQARTLATVRQFLLLLAVELLRASASIGDDATEGG